MKLIDVGYGNMIASERIVAVCSPESAPIKRLISEAKENGYILDVTCGKKTKSVIVLDNDTVVLCSYTSQKVYSRVSGEEYEGE